GYSAAFDYVGLQNFTRAISGDSLFANAFINNLKFMLVVVIGQTAVALTMAVLVVKNTKVNVFLRALYFFPTILSSVSVGFIWKFVYDPNYGVINTVLGEFGVDGLSFMGDAAS